MRNKISGVSQIIAAVYASIIIAIFQSVSECYSDE